MANVLNPALKQSFQMETVCQSISPESEMEYFIKTQSKSFRLRLSF